MTAPAPRSDAELTGLFMRFAEDPRIRIMMLEGSRTNPSVPKDRLRDWDISYFVTDLASYTQDPSWLSHFGRIVMLQTPESMELFEPAQAGESYLMICDDLTKIDLTLYPLSHLEPYLAEEDTLKQVLLDKDGRIPHPEAPTDRPYHLKRPTVGEYTDCLNEFWFVATYVAKGICRGEHLFATDHLDRIQRHECRRMMAWEVGEARGYGFSVGKNDKYLEHYVAPDDWADLMATFQMDSPEALTQSFRTLCALMRRVSRRLGAALGYPYPPFDAAVTDVIERMFRTYGPTTACD